MERVIIPILIEEFEALVMIPKGTCGVTIDKIQHEMTDYHVQLRRIAPSDVKALNLDPVDDITRSQAAQIIHDVRTGGESKLIEIATKFGDLKEGL